MNKVKKLSLVAFSSAIAVFLSSSLVVFAAQGIAAPITDTIGLQKLMCTIIGWIFWFVLVLSVIMILVAAFDYMTAGDDTEKTTRGRKRLTYAAVGILVALLAFAFIPVVSSTIGTTIKLDPTACTTGP